MARFAAIILGGGKSTRMNGIDKMKYMIDGKSVLQISKELFSDFDRVIVVGPDGEIEGGERRQDSVCRGLSLVGDDIDYVLIHDGARPFAGKDIILRIKEALLSGSDAVVPCVKPKDTIRTSDRTLRRDELFAVQTPQGFKASVIKQCYAKAAADGFEGTDDASVAEHCGITADIVEGDYANIKITTRDDLPKPPPENELRFGHGYDLHRLVSGRPLMLGLVQVPYEQGLLGHSDADVIAHAIADAMLGAAALGDIGKLFPDNIKETEGMSGRDILKKTNKAVKDAGYKLQCIDATLVAQRPKVSPYTDAMRQAIAEALETDKDKISVKATTEEGLGPTGEGLAMAAFATALLSRNRG